MRVLNRIVRVTEEGLLYEADPRHAEMLIRAFNLSDAKSVVTPGVKTAIDEDVDPSKVDADIAVEIKRIVAELKCPRRRSKRVGFCPHVKIQDVPAYSTYYGMHPRDFVFARSGENISSSNTKDVFKNEMFHMMSPNMRRSILDRVLRDGAAWETPTTEFLGRIAKKKPAKKFVKARLGSKATKHAERMDMGGEDLDTRRPQCIVPCQHGYFTRLWTAHRSPFQQKSCADTLLIRPSMGSNH